MKDNSEIKYAIYARRSQAKSDREESVASIDSQVSVLKDLAAREKLRVALTLQETVSAKKPGVRPKFEELIRLIK